MAYRLSVHGDCLERTGIFARFIDTDEEGPDLLGAVHHQSIGRKGTLEVAAPAVEPPFFVVDRSGNEVDLVVLINLGGLAVG